MEFNQNASAEVKTMLGEESTQINELITMFEFW